jgi:hypothetical protein
MKKARTRGVGGHGGVDHSVSYVGAGPGSYSGRERQTAEYNSVILKSLMTDNIDSDDLILAQP